MKKMLLTFLVISLMAGCGRGRSEAKVTQVVAKVNGDEITVRQIDTEMASKAVIEPKRQQLVLNELKRLKKLSTIEILDPKFKFGSAVITAPPEHATFLL